MIPPELSQILAGFVLAVAGWLVRHYLGPKSAPAPDSNGLAAEVQQLHADARKDRDLQLLLQALQARVKEKTGA